MWELLKNIDKILMGGSAVLVSLSVGILCWIFDASDQVPMWLLIITIVFSWFVWLVTYVICSKKKVAFSLPAIKSINIDFGVVFLVEGSELYSVDSLVSIYYQDEDDELETFLGIGYVETRNSNSCFQIRLKNVSEVTSAKKILKTIKNDSQTKRSIKIKPSITKECLGGDL